MDGEKSVVVITLHKSASMFIYTYFKKISEFKNIHFFSENDGTLLDMTKGDKYYLQIKQNSDNPYILAPYRVPSFNLDYFLEDIKDFSADNCRFIAHIRNPIDILISSYYSFGFLHSEPVNEDEKPMFFNRRTEIQTTTIDEFCLKHINRILKKIKIFYKFISDNPNVIISSYYEMKLDFKTWNKKMCSLLNLDTEHSNNLYDSFETDFKLKPLDNSEVISGESKRHIRNGSNFQYLTELKPETVNLLKKSLADVIPKQLLEYPDFFNLKIEE